jgi:ABC-type glycerol-3-phosphate transport system substrate-binding protein
MFYDMANKGVTPLPGATPQGVDPFAGELVAMKSDGSWATNSTRDAVGDRFEWDVVKFPKGSTGKRYITPAGGGWGISATTKSPDQAWTFLNHIASTESINTMVAEPVRSVPGRQSSAKVWEEAVSKGGLPPKNAGIFPQLLQEDALNVVYPAFYKEFEQIWGQRAGGIFTGTPVAEALETMQTEVEELLQRG